MKQMFYYSTNQSIQTVYKIRQERQAKINNIQREWSELNEKVDDNWIQLFHNARLLEGQTSHLGFDIQVVESDEWAPDRVWIHFHTPNGRVSIEFHYFALLKRINMVKIDSVSGILSFTNEMSFAKRALEILL